MKKILLLSCLALAGCSWGQTHSPDLVVPAAVSFGADGLQDAGMKGVVKDKKTGELFETIDEADRQTYNRLIGIYGKGPYVSLTPDEGLISFRGRYAIRNDCLTDFNLMKALARGTLGGK